MKVILDIIKEHIEYGQQILKLAKADLVKTYRGAALGWGWAVIKPVVMIFVYWFAFTVGLRAGKDVGEYPFFLWMLVGMVPWFYVSDMLMQGTNTLRKYNYLVKEIRFPISIIPTFISLANFIIHIILILGVIIIFALWGYKPDIYLLQLPFYMLLMLLFFTVWTLFSSIISGVCKDFSNLVKSFITAIFWLSAILWDVNKVEIPWVKRILMLNPITFLVNGYRNCFTEKVWFFEQPKRLIYFAIIFVITTILALLAYKKLRKELPDVL